MPRIEITGNGGMHSRTINTHDPRIIGAWLVEQLNDLASLVHPITITLEPGFYMNGAPDWPLVQTDGQGTITIDPGTSARATILGLRRVLDGYLETMPRDAGAPNI